MFFLFFWSEFEPMWLFHMSGVLSIRVEALSPQFWLGNRPDYLQAEGLPPPSFQSPAADTDGSDSKLGQRTSTCPDARCYGRSETAHDRRVYRAEDMLR